MQPACKHLPARLVPQIMIQMEINVQIYLQLKLQAKKIQGPIVAEDHC